MTTIERRTEKVGFGNNAGDTLAKRWKSGEPEEPKHGISGIGTEASQPGENLVPLTPGEAGLTEQTAWSFPSNLTDARRSVTRARDAQRTAQIDSGKK